MGNRMLVGDLAPIVNDNKKRIERLEKTKEQFDDHLQKHHDVLDKTLQNHQEVLFGEKGDDGLVFDVKQIMTIKKDLNGLKWAVIAAAVIEIVLRFLK